jgi:hypothetical protein
MNTIKIFVKNLFGLPVTRVDVLKRARDYKWTSGLCIAIKCALWDFNIPTEPKNVVSKLYFPEFNRKSALVFGADPYSVFWWEVHNWSTGRERYLNYLINCYKDDKINLRKLAYDE